MPFYNSSSGFNNAAYIEVKLPIILFMENDTFIAYVPGLDLSGYGISEDKAKESLDIVIKDYLDYTLAHHTLHQDLIDHGFQLDESKSLLQIPNIFDVVKQNAVFSDLFEGKTFHKTDKSIQIPAYC